MEVSKSTLILLRRSPAFRVALGGLLILKLSTKMAVQRWFHAMTTDRLTHQLVQFGCRR
ncbi:TPA: hypothetical protein TXJ06_001170 [Streptococcus suis]|nr:hypothetical protein [Streptococcus suis]